MTDLYNYLQIAAEDEGRIIIMTLHRPETLNAFHSDMVSEMLTAVRAFQRTPRSRVLIITGSGRAFCAGADIGLMGDRGDIFEAFHKLEGLHELIKLMYGGSKPVIAAVNGAAAGGGASLALCCDYVVTNAQSCFVQPFLNLALLPDMGAIYFLARRIGMVRTKELLWSQRRVYGPEAYDLGLASHLVDDHTPLLEEARRLARQLASLPATALGVSKQMIHHALDQSLDAFLAEERTAQSLFMASPAHQEGKRAFQEKRKPDFQPFEEF